MAGEVQVTEGDWSSLNKTQFDVDFLCDICTEDEGGKCNHFTEPNKNVCCCNKFKSGGKNGRN